MLTLPARHRRKKQPYIAIRSRLLRRQVMRQAQLFLPELRNFMQEQDIPIVGPSFFRYNTISQSGEMDIEFGYFTDRLYSGSGPARAGILPAGSFVSVKWNGSYERMDDVNAMLMGWVKVTGVECDCASTEDGMFYGCRIDIFHSSIHDQPDPDRWLTEVAVMVKAPSGQN